MSDQTDNKMDIGRCIAFLFILGIILLPLVSCGLAGPHPSSQPVGTHIARTALPTTESELIEVRTNCGECGTNSPVGAWQSFEGRGIIMTVEGNFIMFTENGNQYGGTWELSENSLCLTYDENGSTECLDYEQKVDAMRLRDAIYYRK